MRRISFIKRMQDWMDCPSGQMFLNYAYSWGASVVILGALFKLTHLPGADLMLYLGMGTEVVVFFISAFDHPLYDNGNVNSVGGLDARRVSETPGSSMQIDKEMAEIYNSHKEAAEKQLAIANENIAELGRLNKSIQKLNEVYESALAAFGVSKDKQVR